MNLTDDQLREALRCTADEYAAARVPRLDLAGDAVKVHLHRRLAPRAAIRRGLLPVAVAAAVTAIIVAANMLAPGHQTPAPASPSALLPPYYVELQKLPAEKGYVTPHNWPPRDEVVVQSSATGARLATIAPPRG